MSNKPKIYASCPAGCNWETVHKDDFENSYPLVRQDLSNGVLNVVKGKKYRIFDTGVSSEAYSFSIKIKFNDSLNTLAIPLPTFDKYKNYVDFKLLDVLLDEQKNETIIIYELDSVRKDLISQTGFYTIRTHSAQFDAKTGEVFDNQEGLIHYNVVESADSQVQITKQMFASYGGVQTTWREEYGVWKLYWDCNNVFFMGVGDKSFTDEVEGKIVDVKIKEGFYNELPIDNINSKITKVVWKKTYTPAGDEYEYAGLVHTYVSGDYSGEGVDSVVATYKLPAHFELDNVSWSTTDASGYILFRSEVEGKNYRAYYRSPNVVNSSNLEQYYTCYVENLKEACIVNEGCESVVDTEGVKQEGTFQSDEIIIAHSQEKVKGSGKTFTDTISDNATDDKIPTEKAVKDAIDNAGSGGSVEAPIIELTGTDAGGNPPIFSPSELEQLKNPLCTILWKETANGIQYSFKPMDEFDPDVDMSIYFICVDTDNKKIRRIWIAFDENAWYYDEILFATLADLEKVPTIAYLNTIPTNPTENSPRNICVEGKFYELQKYVPEIGVLSATYSLSNIYEVDDNGTKIADITLPFNLTRDIKIRFVVQRGSQGAMSYPTVNGTQYTTDTPIEINGGNVEIGTGNSTYNKNVQYNIHYTIANFAYRYVEMATKNDLVNKPITYLETQNEMPIELYTESHFKITGTTQEIATQIGQDFINAVINKDDIISVFADYVGGDNVIFIKNTNCTDNMWFYNVLVGGCSIGLVHYQCVNNIHTFECVEPCIPVDEKLATKQDKITVVENADNTISLVIE